MQNFSLSPKGLLGMCWTNRGVILALARRDIASRYRGSLVGMLWSLFIPLLMLAVYTFVFGVIFQARWGGSTGSTSEFALVLFAGLMVFTLFAECIGKASGLVSSNPNYVKKIIFPLEVLPFVSLGAAVFHLAISFLVWLVFYCVIFGLPKITILLFPVVLLPILLLILGASWFLASLGVYMRDISQLITVIIPSLMFLSPIFYPASALPDSYRWLFMLNPLTPVIEWSRAVLIWGEMPDWRLYGTCFFFSVIAALFGFAWFQKTRKGFGDVL